MGPLSSNVKITKVADHTTAGTDAVTSAEVNMAGYEGVMFVTSFGTANAGNLLKAQQDTATGMASAADLEGTSVTSGTSDEDVWLDVYKPREQFVRVYATRGASSTLESIWAIQYGPRYAAPDNTTSGTITGEQHVSPAEGTA
jgi:hypothetical protein